MPVLTSASKMPEIATLDTQEELNAFCEECRSAGRFAFDTEFVMEESFEPVLCLIQIATDTRVALVDPFMEIDPTPIWELVSDEDVETVVHSGQEDLGLCVHHTGRAPRRIHDTQVAAGFAGYGYPLSLQKLVQATLHIRLHKSKTLTDWRRRPLTDAQIKYAADDVYHLPAVRDKLHARLTAQNRLAWMQEESVRFEDTSLYCRGEEQKLKRIKGAGALKGRQLAILRELLAWREEAAERLDRPVRAVLRDHLLVEVSKHELCSHKEVRDLRGLNLSDRAIRDMCQRVCKAMETPSEQWPRPEPRDTETASETVLIPLITGVIRSYCDEHELAYGLVASKKSIRDLIRHKWGASPKDRCSVELLQGWRGETLGRILEDVLAGNRAIRVGTSHDEPLIKLPRAGEIEPDSTPA